MPAFKDKHGFLFPAGKHENRLRHLTAYALLMIIVCAFRWSGSYVYDLFFLEDKPWASLAIVFSAYLTVEFLIEFDTHYQATRTFKPDMDNTLVLL